MDACGLCKYGGGSVLVWGGVNIGQLDWIMDAEMYSQLLIQQSIPPAKYLTVNGLILQLDKIPSTL